MCTTCQDCSCDNITLPIAIGPTGPAGPTGPQGPIGLTGPQGPTGPAGEATNLSVKINSADGINLTSVVSNGVAPYTYLWEFADFGSQFKFNTPTNVDNVQVIPEPLTISVFDADASTNAGRVSLVKLIVTDSVGNIAKDTYLCIQINPL